MKTLHTILFSTLLVAPSCWAWNNFGHEVIAASAYAQLTPAAKTRVATLLKLNPNYTDWIAGIDPAQQDEVAFIKAATWPDYIKHAPGYANDGEEPTDPNAAQNVGYSDKLMHRYWHYYDTPFSPDGTALIQPKIPNAQTQIHAFRASLAAPNATDDLKSYDLVWLLHLVGDVHQPLHATSRFTHDDTNGDRGGNDVKLCTASACNSELHAYWDDVLGTSSKITSVEKYAGQLPTPTAHQASISDESTWIDESFKAAKKTVYADPVGNSIGPFTLTADYKTKAKTLARKRAALAAARLANVINNELQ